MRCRSVCNEALQWSHAAWTTGRAARRRGRGLGTLPKTSTLSSPSGQRKFGACVTLVYEGWSRLSPRFHESMPGVGFVRKLR